MQQPQLFQMAFPLLILVVFYVFLIRPQKQKDKEHQEMLKALAKNDEVVTTGGIHGTVVNIKDKTVTLRIDDNARMEVEKSCIAQILAAARASGVKTP